MGTFKRESSLKTDLRKKGYRSPQLCIYGKAAEITKAVSGSGKNDSNPPNKTG